MPYETFMPPSNRPPPVNPESFENSGIYPSAYSDETRASAPPMPIQRDISELNYELNQLTLELLKVWGSKLSQKADDYLFNSSHQTPLTRPTNMGSLFQSAEVVPAARGNQALFNYRPTNIRLGNTFRTKASLQSRPSSHPMESQEQLERKEQEEQTMRNVAAVSGALLLAAAFTCGKSLGEISQLCQQKQTAEKLEEEFRDHDHNNGSHVSLLDANKGLIEQKLLEKKNKLASQVVLASSLTLSCIAGLTKQRELFSLGIIGSIGSTAFILLQMGFDSKNREHAQTLNTALKNFQRRIVAETKEHIGKATNQVI